MLSWYPGETNCKITIPYLFRGNNETCRVDNFWIAAGLKTGQHTGNRYSDSDIYEAIKATANSLKTNPERRKGNCP